MADLLPATKELLLEILDGLDVASNNLPELRVGRPGRGSCRYWLYGQTQKTSEGRRPAAQFQELETAGLLRKLRVDKSTGTYYGFTAEAFRERDRLLSHARSSPSDSPASKTRPAEPAPELDAAKSRLEMLRELCGKARASLEKLVAASAIEDRVKNEPGSGVVFITPHPWKWGALDPADRPLLGLARDDANAWLNAARTTLSAIGPEYLDEFDDLSGTVRRMYDRSASADGPVSESLERNVERATQAVDSEFDLLADLPNAHENTQLILVPDTNALLTDPDLESWQVGSQECTIAIVSQVQAELDAHKVSDRKISEKANTLIRRFKEYGRRGNTLTGVPLSGRIRFREVPIRPDMTKAPDWLDKDQPDDCILAAALELASRHLSSRVVLVTRDRGLQNKARAAEIPAMDVQDL